MNIYRFRSFSPFKYLSRRFSSTLVPCRGLSEDYSAIEASKCFKNPVDIILLPGQYKIEEYIKKIQTLYSIRHFYICPSMYNALYTDEYKIYEIIKYTANQSKPNIICSASNILSMRFMPRLAAFYGIQPITDICHIEDNDTFVRTINKGSILCTVQCLDPIKIITIKPSAFAPNFTNADIKEPQIIKLNLDHISPLPCEETMLSDTLNLSNARNVIIGGRGIRSAQDFELLLKPLASKLNAAIGATRAAVQSGYISSEFQVGEKGHTITSDLCICIGVSGAPQHVAGLRHSKAIIAINNDPNALIFSYATYGIVGDLYNIIPELTASL